MHRLCSPKSGFSLVELSIVLVILGLLTGGILTGQSLIKAAELRAVTTEFNQFQAAARAFQGKYFALPGDMMNATSFWGAAHATPATCLTTVGTGTQTCNGNGDGKLTFANLATTGYNEMFMFWQHLGNAGLLEGNFTGRSGSANAVDATLGVNVPGSRFSNGGWAVTWMGEHLGDVHVFYNKNMGTHFSIGAASTANFPLAPLFTPEEAWNIDTKMDDGKPAYGKVTARYWNNACSAADDGTSAATDLNASYRLTVSSVQCQLFFLQAL